MDNMQCQMIALLAVVILSSSQTTASFIPGNSNWYNIVIESGGLEWIRYIERKYLVSISRRDMMREFRSKF